MKRRACRTGRGYAMVLTVSLTMVLSMMAMALLTATRSDLEGSRAMQGRSEARNLSVSALEFVYAELVSDADVATALLDNDAATSPSLSGFATQSQYGTESSPWAAWDGSNLVPCPDLLVDCVTFTARPDTDGNGTLRGLVLDATARSRCQGWEPRCVYTRFQQRLRKAELFDFLFFQQYSTLDPDLYDPGLQIWAYQNCAERYAYRVNAESSAPARDPSCVSVAYNGESLTRRDVITGPVYTSDDWIVVCGDPQFASMVSVAGAGYPPASATPQVWAAAGALNSADACPSTSNSLIPADQQEIQAPLLLLPEPTSAAEAANVASSQYVFTPADPALPVTLTLTTAGAGPAASTTVSVSGSTADPASPLPLPENPGVIVVQGDVDVSGVLAGPLSIFSAGDLTITGDLVYEGGAVRSNTRDVLGLTAAGSVSITQDAVPVDREINAIILATSGSVFVQGWQFSRAADPEWITPPTLTFFGAMASRYQGVFAGYRTDSGEVVSGFRKAFSYDDRMSSALVVPPYLLSLTSQTWQRLPAVEVPANQ